MHHIELYVSGLEAAIKSFKNGVPASAGRMITFTL